MVKTKNQVISIVRRYVGEVAKQYKVSKVILFGSYATGSAKSHSDIDLVIVSPDFRKKSEMEILENLSRIAAKVSPLLEVLAMTPEDLKSPDPRSFSYQVKRTGLSIAA
ncbi:MAG: nucleotidyltransferase domain-containing protein [Deltaproteobacteria bacterium]|nr:nucleotidyltransferase domain-containing protein [Deltaproteobacteria bacterium]